MARGEPLIRQWNLLKALQAHRFGIDAAELAERLECSKRQVQRDLGVLQQVGFPISYEERDYGKRFWKLAPQFIEREGLVLSVTEMVSLFLSRQLLAPLTGTQFGDGLVTALDKIHALLPKKALHYFTDLDDTLLVKNLAQPDYSGQGKEVRILNEAIAERRVLKIHYLSARLGKLCDWTLHPYGLVLFGMNLYCIGHVEQEGQVRVLKVIRIQGVETTARTFRRPEGFSLSEYLQGAFGVFAAGQPQTITVRLTGWAATNVREQQWHPSQKIIEDERDHVVARFQLSDTTEFKRWILGFGRCARVMQPKALAEEIAAELTAARDGYKSV